MAEQGLHLGQDQRLSQVIAPQMQQSLQILQTPALELSQLLRAELSQNPVLEEEFNEIPLEPEEMEEDPLVAQLRELSALDDEWQDEARRQRPQNDAQERHQFLIDSAVSSPSLQQHLLAQLSLTSPLPEVTVAAEAIIGDIDERGYLQTPITDLALALAIPLPDLQKAESIIRGFEPAGIAAVDLRDCLLLQLERLGRASSLEAKIVDHHLEDLARHRHPEIARKLGVTPEQVTLAAESIAALDPDPAGAFSSTPSHYITPDIKVTLDNGDYIVSLMDEHLPRLRISSAYKEMLAEGEMRGEAGSYIRDKIRSGKFLMRSIDQRQDTIQRIAEEIVKRQRAFLDHGPDHISPLRMAEISEIIEVHETTVSRAVAGKYMLTPHGTYELRHFFNSGYQKESGEALSNISVKNRIAELVKEEDTTKPLSDQKIVTLLQKEGLKVARRTVAKYRDALNILPSNLRRTYGKSA